MVRDMPAEAEPLMAYTPATAAEQGDHWLIAMDGSQRNFHEKLRSEEVVWRY